MKKYNQKNPKNRFRGGAMSGHALHHLAWNHRQKNDQKDQNQ